MMMTDQIQPPIITHKAKAREKPVICFAQITNRMGSVENDFEKGEALGSLAALELIDQAAGYWVSQTNQ